MKIKLKSMLQAFYDDSNVRVDFKPFDKSWYIEKWDESESLRPLIPEFYCRNIELEDTKVHELQSHYIRARGNLEGIGEKTYILVSIEANEVQEKPFAVLTFIPVFNSFPIPRLLFISPDGKKVYRNDFKDVCNRQKKDKNSDLDFE